MLLPLRRLFVLILLTTLCLSCHTPQGRSPSGDFSPDQVDGDLPIALDFSLKNGRGDTLIVHYFRSKLFVAEQVGSRTSAYSVLPGTQDWSEFWQAVGSVHIWDWSSGIDPGQPDYWSLDLVSNEHKLSIAGTYFERGVYSGKDGWLVFAAAIERLIHHEPAVLRASTQKT